MSKNKRHFQFQSKQKINFIDTYVYSFSKLVISLAMEANSFSYMAKSNPQGDQFCSKLKF